MKSSQQLQESLSTYQWMAPETLGNACKKVEYDEKADVYSFAVILWEILTLEFPFGEYLAFEEYSYTAPSGEVVFNADALKEAIESKKLRPTIPTTAPEHLKSLIRKCWSHKPSNRPSFNEIVKILAPEMQISQTMDVVQTFNTISYKKENDQQSDVTNSIICQSTVKLNKSPEFAPSKLCVVNNYLWVGVHNGTILVYDITNPKQVSFYLHITSHIFFYSLFNFISFFRQNLLVVGKLM